MHIISFIRCFKIILFAIFFIFCGCEKIAGIDKKSSDAADVFDEACAVIDTRYALFSLKSVDWQAACKNKKQLVPPAMADRDLFKLLSNHLMSLEDGHVSLISKDDTATYTGFFTNYPTNFNLKNIFGIYLNNSYRQSGPFIYTKQDSVGYLYYDSFYKNFSDDDMNQVFLFLKNLKGLILDVRNNTGGNYSNVEKLFSHFITNRQLVKYEMAKRGPGHKDFFDPEPYYVQPASGNLFSKKICILTNRKCFSACNDFASFMGDLPNVYQVGDTTGGGGGLPYRYMLRNGWFLQYTATKTLSSKKLPIENGIAPDYLITMTPVDETRGKDPIIEKAFDLLK